LALLAEFRDHAGAIGLDGAFSPGGHGAGRPGCAAVGNFVAVALSQASITRSSNRDPAGNFKRVPARRRP
jgi:hypothetical protein